MTNRYPLIVNTSTNQIQELSASDNLDLTSSGIVNATSIGATNINVTGVVTASSFVGSFTGTITGTASTASFATTSFGLAGTPNITVGTVTGNLTGNATGLSGSPNITVTGVNASGVVTATSFSGSGANLTGISSVSFATTSFGLSGSPAILVSSVGINTTTTNNTKLYLNGNAASNIVTLTDGETITPDFTLGNNFQVTIAATRNLANPTGVTTGQSGVIFIQQNATGGYSLSYGTSWDFASATPPTLITTANALNALPYFARSTTSIVVGSVISGIGTL